MFTLLLILFLSSSLAFLVKVITRISEGFSFFSSIRYLTLYSITFVLPEPAPSITVIFFSVEKTGKVCSQLRFLYGIIEIISFSVRIFLEILFSFSIFSFLFHIREFSFREQLDKKIEITNITKTLFTQISVKSFLGILKYIQIGIF